MDEESGLWPFLSRLFGSKNGHTIEKRIEEAAEEGELKADEMDMLLNVLRLGRRQVFDIMIPRTDIVCAEVNDDVREVMDKIVASGHSRLPVFKENKDNIIGILYAKDLLKALMAQDCPAASPAARPTNGPAAGPAGADPADIAALMRQPFFIPETKNVKDLIQEFRLRKVHLAIALDEWGGTSGLVTFEDLLEQIVGDIEDEYDAPLPEDIQKLEDGRYLVSGRTMLEEMAEETGVVLESEHVETVGGWLTEQAGHVPGKGECFPVAGGRLEVTEADPKQVFWTVLHLGADRATDKPSGKPADAGRPAGHDAGGDDAATPSRSSSTE